MLQRVLIDTRDYVYHLAKRQSGSESAKSEYQFKILGTLSAYYLGILMLVAHFVSNFFSLQSGKNLSLLGRFVVGTIIYLIPMWFLVKYVIKLIKDVPIPEEITDREYKRKRVVWLAVLIIGIIFSFVAAFLPIYLTGGKIHIGDHIIQRK